MRLSIAYMLVILFTLCLGITAQGMVIELFEDDPDFTAKIPNTDTATTIEAAKDVKYQGKISIRLESDPGVNNGQHYSPNIAGWTYQITKNPGADDEARWILFAWKKDAGEGIMIQFPNNGAWGGQPNGGRYFDGVNKAGWAGIQLAEEAPREWEVQIRDLFDDFGEFTLTGIALTQYDNVGYYDSIYLAWTEKELKDMLNKWEPVEPLEKLAIQWGKVKIR